MLSDWLRNVGRTGASVEKLRAKGLKIGAISNVVKDWPVEPETFYRSLRMPIQTETDGGTITTDNCVALNSLPRQVLII